MSTPYKKCPKCGRYWTMDIQQCKGCGVVLTNVGQTASSPVSNPVINSQQDRSNPLQCKRCHRTFNLLTQIQFDRQTGLCRSCLDAINKDRQMRIDKFQAAFRHHLFKTAIVMPNELLYFHQYAQQLNLPTEDAFASVKQDAIHLLNRAFTIVKADGVITKEEEQYILQLQQALMLSSSDVSIIRNELRTIKIVQEIRSGILPVVKSTITLPSSEICHWDTQATYHKVLTQQTKLLPGRLIITNQKVRFVSDFGGFDFALSKVAHVNYRRPSGVHLQLTRTQGNGYYEVPQGELLYEIMHVSLRRHHRQEVLTQEGSRALPQDIKVAVWQRDGGKCVQCGASDYLEFDHIIPFSKGGATSINNIQLLCRRCNLAKSDNL